VVLHRDFIALLQVNGAVIRPFFDVIDSPSTLRKAHYARPHPVLDEQRSTIKGLVSYVLVAIRFCTL
jgi:hypothetical protein